MRIVNSMSMLLLWQTLHAFERSCWDLPKKSFTMDSFTSSIIQDGVHFDKTSFSNDDYTVLSFNQEWELDAKSSLKIDIDAKTLPSSQETRLPLWFTFGPHHEQAILCKIPTSIASSFALYITNDPKVQMYDETTKFHQSCQYVKHNPFDIDDSAHSLRLFISEEHQNMFNINSIKASHYDCLESTLKANKRRRRLLAAISLDCTAFTDWTQVGIGVFPALGTDTTNCYVANPCIKITGNTNTREETYVEQTVDVLWLENIIIDYQIYIKTIEADDSAFIETICGSDTTTSYPHLGVASGPYSGSIDLSGQSCDTLTLRIGGYFDETGDKFFLNSVDILGDLITSSILLDITSLTDWTQHGTGTFDIESSSSKYCYLESQCVVVGGTGSMFDDVYIEQTIEVAATWNNMVLKYEAYARAFGVGDSLFIETVCGSDTTQIKPHHNADNGPYGGSMNLIGQSCTSLTVRVGGRLQSYNYVYLNKVEIVHTGTNAPTPAPSIGNFIQITQAYQYQTGGVGCDKTRTCHIECNAENSCRDTQIRCPDSSECTVECNAVDACREATIEWPASSGLGSIVCGATSSCQDVTFPIPDPTTATTITCDEASECKDSKIFCPASATCDIICTHANACANVSITYPLSIASTVTCDYIHGPPCDSDSIANPPSSVTVYNLNTEAPTSGTSSPTRQPTVPTSTPTKRPSKSPTNHPSIPSQSPTITTQYPTLAPAGRFIEATTSYQYQVGGLNCTQGEPCHIMCSGGNTCRNTVIRCPESHRCLLECSGLNGCRSATIEWPNTAGLGMLLCDGSRSCFGITFPVPDPNTPTTITCDKSSECKDSDLICPTNAACDIFCVHDTACDGVTITYPPSVPSTVTCDYTFDTPCDSNSINNPPSTVSVYNLGVPSSYPTPSPTKRPVTMSPTRTPTHDPSGTPTKYPTQNPTMSPTVNPTSNPSKYPTRNPAAGATDTPTSYPTRHPTKYPTGDPTTYPTKHPTINPTSSTMDPSSNPTIYPTEYPTINPTAATMDPSLNPTTYPTKYPTINPTSATMDPSFNPTAYPTKYSSINPTSVTTNPSSNPTTYPTVNPTSYPTRYPTVNPTLYKYPTDDPTINPTQYTTIAPTIDTTVYPLVTINPTYIFTNYQTVDSTVDTSSGRGDTSASNPTIYPTEYPTINPTAATMDPSLNPTTYPTK
eukprot:527629_1